MQVKFEKRRRPYSFSHAEYCLAAFRVGPQMTRNGLSFSRGSLRYRSAPTRDLDKGPEVHATWREGEKESLTVPGLSSVSISAKMIKIIK